MEKQQQRMKNPLQDPALAELLLKKKQLQAELNLIEGELKSKKRGIQDFMEMTAQDTMRVGNITAIRVQGSYSVSLAESLDKLELEELFQQNEVLQRFFKMTQRPGYLRLRVSY